MMPFYVGAVAALIFGGLGVLKAAELHAEIKRDTTARKAGHDPEAYGCKFWAGDRAGVDLRARCGVCDP